MTNKNKVGYWIKRKGNTKLSDTAPEQDFSRFAKSRGYTITQGEPIWSGGWRLRPDFDMQLGKQTQIVILVDGPYHWTDIQAQKDRWRDELYNKVGKKVVHIDAELVLERYWPDLAEMFLKAILSKELATYLRQ